MHRMLVSAALFIAAPAAAATQEAPAAPMLHEGTLLDIVAEGQTTRVPDLATIRAGVVTQGSTAAEAMRANATRMDRVMAALRSAGVAERDIRTATVSLQPQYRYAENEPPTITGYQANNSVTIRFRDVARSGTILDALVREGANQIDGPQLSLADPAAALDEARKDAVQAARSRAQLYAEAAGLRVVRILSIREQGSNAPAPPPMARMRAASAESDTQIAPGEQDVTVTLDIRFLLQ